MIRALVLAAAVVAFSCPPVYAQTALAPGFIDIRGHLFPQKTPTDETRQVADALYRQEGFLRPASWLQFVGGVDLRTNTHRQVEDIWRIDW